MSHEIVSAVYSAMEGAGWTGLGVPIPEDVARDPRKIAELCGATYQVAKVPVYIEVEPGRFERIPGREALQRDDNGEVFEIVSDNRYHVENRQPCNVFESFRDELAKESLVISHAAILRGGRIITVCAKLAEPVQEGDKILSYVTGSTGYDKAHGTNYFLTSIRTVCANTLAMGLSESENGGRLFHSTAAQRLESDSLHNMLEAASTVIKSERDFLGELHNVRMTNQQVRDYFARILDVEPEHVDKVDKITGKPFVSTRTRNQLLALASAYVHAPGADAGMGTLYGALQAVTYFTDHEGQTRDTTKDGKIASRLASVMFGNGAAVKLRAVREARQMAMLKVAA